MTVKQLIAKLKKMPQNATVYLADHDHHAFEINGPAGSVEEVDMADFDTEQAAVSGLSEGNRLEGVIVRIQVG